MPSWSSLDAWYRDVVGFSRELTGPEALKVTRAQGLAAQKIAAQAASADVGGDMGFSGWNRGAVIKLDTRLFKIRDGHVLAPTRSGAGPWTVAEFGRNSKAGPRLVGPRLTRTGRVSKARRRRYNGRTVGKQTASTATERMDKELPKIASREVLKFTRKRFDVT